MRLGSNIAELEQSDIDANIEGVTDSLTLQVSSNDSDFYDTTATLIGCGTMPDKWYSANYVRLKIATPEGVASKINIQIIAK